MTSRSILAILAFAAASCNSVGNEISGIIVCPTDAENYVKSLIGSPIPENREQVELAIKDRNLRSEIFETSEARSPFCDKSVAGKVTMQAHFPLQEEGQIRVC